MAYYGEPAKSPAIFFKAYIQSTTEEFRQSEEAPKIDSKNPAGWLRTLSYQSKVANTCFHISNWKFIGISLNTVKEGGGGGGECWMKWIGKNALCTLILLVITLLLRVKIKISYVWQDRSNVYSRNVRLFPVPMARMHAAVILPIIVLGCLPFTQSIRVEIFGINTKWFSLS